MQKQKKETAKIQEQLESQVEVWTDKLKEKNAKIAQLSSQFEEQYQEDN